MAASIRRIQILLEHGSRRTDLGSSFDDSSLLETKHSGTVRHQGTFPVTAFYRELAKFIHPTIPPTSAGRNGGTVSERRGPLVP